MKQVIALAVAALSAFAMPAARATTIYDNGIPGGPAGAQEATFQVVADNFLLGTASTVTGAGIYLGEYINSGLVLNLWDGTVQYKLYTQSSGLPGALIASGSGINLAITDTGNLFLLGGTIKKVVFDLAAPVALSAGTPYWLGIHLSTNFDSDYAYWASINSSGPGNAVNSNGGIGVWTDTGQDQAFYLIGSPVPEPGTSLLLALGLAGLALRRRLAAGLDGLHRGVSSAAVERPGLCCPHRSRAQAARAVTLSLRLRRAHSWGEA